MDDLSLLFAATARALCHCRAWCQIWWSFSRTRKRRFAKSLLLPWSRSTGTSARRCGLTSSRSTACPLPSKSSSPFCHSWCPLLFCSVFFFCRSFILNGPQFSSKWFTPWALKTRKFSSKVSPLGPFCGPFFAFDTVKASNFGPHGNFAIFLASSVTSVDESCAKNEQNWICRSKVFLQILFSSFFCRTFFNDSKLFWRRGPKFPWGSKLGALTVVGMYCLGLLWIAKWTLFRLAPSHHGCCTWELQ